MGRTWITNRCRAATPWTSTSGAHSWSSGHCRAVSRGLENVDRRRRPRLTISTHGTQSTSRQRPNILSADGSISATNPDQS
ncbi:hypothetical protein LUX57_35605 [Actinomadura madurae]|uniref:hypothetical protein n=1 Tax=Actinomadura madurae TaxID=1993 RepID=UPI0020D21919|nr:hypothetical protein [Actinomadura madurae]MCP9969859.1 hypothetical protein [Actinomadura madurae]